MGIVMGKKSAPLSALEVSRLKNAGLYFVGDVAGLALQVSSTGAKSWILRATVGAKRRDIGLGGYPDVTLAKAKEAAREMRAAIKNGVDPVEAKKAKRSALLADQAKELTFTEAALAYIKAREPEWNNAKHAAQWRSTLEAYAFPTIGKLLVRDVELHHILQILEPIWTTKTETASRLRGRIENILDWAAVRGYRPRENPARWRGHLDMVLPKPSKVAKVEHHPALPYVDVGQFMKELGQVNGIGARALEFLIITATRSGEVRGATWDEINLKTRVWTIPAHRMKAGKEHRVPLSERAVKLLESLPRLADINFVFPGTRGGMISDITISAVLKRMEKDVVPHGFRSTFRDWASECTNYPREVAEQALAHTLSDKVERAYRRGDLFEKRRRMMEDWAAYTSQPITVTGDVVPLFKTT